MSDAVHKTPGQGDITLTEMTRRRDHWRGVAQRMDAAYARELLRARAAERRLTHLKNDRDALIRQLNSIERELAASQAETRRYVEELGALRDQLGERDSHGD